MEDDYYDSHEDNEHAGERGHSLQFKIACGALLGTMAVVAIPIAFGSKEPVKHHNPPANPVSNGIYNTVPDTGDQAPESHAGNAWMTDAALGGLALAGLTLGTYVMRRPKPLSEPPTESELDTEPLDLYTYNESGMSAEEKIAFEDLVRNNYPEDPNQK